ncbi:hypothetical protein KP79_PYT24455 [Mizuhopecten yessoensis]|uniref:DUF4218 domain-containing protein n=2 Tax=Mizuhopecten yessoensis TaxID=6573 RepID=A0A210QKR4_MIZYE|nr:hypothetical protein KP79_PYT24455 [Mizuhopecten yessoensis]
MQVVAEHITKLLNGDEDGPKVRAQERSMNRFVGCCPDEVFETYVKEKKTVGQKRKRQHDHQAANGESAAETNMEKRYPKGHLPPAPFTLTCEEKKQADARLSSMHFPVGFGDVPGSLFTHIRGGVKSHTWNRLFTNGVLRYCLRGMLGTEQRESLNNFLMGLETLFKSPSDLNTNDQVAEGWHVTLCRMERDFPLSLQSFVMHLLHHLPSYVKLYGPPSNFWMFPYERFIKTLSECITNSRYPELNVVKKMETQWLVNMLDIAGFLEPLRSRPEPQQTGLRYLEQGAYRPKPQPVNELERKALARLFGIPALTNQCITVFHYAKRHLGGSEVQYRDSSVEDPNQREKACMVACDLPQGQFVGVVKYFFSCVMNTDTHELVFMEWIGKPEQCSDSKCFKVQRTLRPPPPLTWVSQLSAPLIYAWDKEVLWIPMM